MSGESDTPAPITVNVIPTFSDFLSFNLRFRFLRAKLIIFFGIFWLGAFAYGAYAVQFLQGPPGPAKSVATVAILTVPVLAFVLMPLGTYWNAKRQWQASPSIREQTQYTFTGDGIRVIGATAASFVTWPNVNFAQRVGQQVLLATGQQFFLIPLWAFNTSDEARLFRELVESRVPAARL